MNNKRTRFSAILIFIVFYSITSCVSYVKPVDEHLLSKKYPFIENGKITKDEILSKLYIPWLAYKKDSIWIYRIKFDEELAFYDLVLVFDENGLLSKHSLIKSE